MSVHVSSGRQKGTQRPRSQHLLVGHAVGPSHESCRARVREWPWPRESQRKPAMRQHIAVQRLVPDMTLERSERMASAVPGSRATSRTKLVTCPSGLMPNAWGVVNTLSDSENATAVNRPSAYEVPTGWESHQPCAGSQGSRTAPWQTSQAKPSPPRWSTLAGLGNRAQP
jgi:hypothetical protein